MHRVWITDPDRPHRPPDSYVRKIPEEAAAAPDWRLLLWTNVKALGRDIADELRTSGAAVDLRTFAEAMAGDPLVAVIDQYVADRKYVSASDVARMLVLREEGGLYADMVVQTSPALFALIEHGAAMLNIDDQAMCQINAFAVPSHDSFLTLWCDIRRDPHPLTAVFHQSGRGVSAIEELSLLSSPGFTAMILLFMSPQAPLLIVPQQSPCLVISSQNSWYREAGKFGNVIVSKTAPTRLSGARHDRLRVEIEVRLERARQHGALGFSGLIANLYGRSFATEQRP